MAIIINTFRDLLRWKSTILYIVIMVVLPTIIGFVLKYEIYEGSMSYESQINFTIGIYYILVFMWILGIPFLIVVSAKGIGLISNELSDGTLELLISMRISRYQIVLYKWFALYMVTILLGIFGIIGNISIITTISAMDSNIKALLIKSIPNLIEYLFLVGFIFSSIALLISLLIKSKIFSTISMTIFLIFIFLIIPLFKTFLNQYYEKYNLFYYDLNYHFSSMYFYFVSKSTFFISPTIKTIMGTFIGVFDVKNINDADTLVITNLSLMKDATLKTYFSPINTIYFWIIFSIVSLLLSIIILTKRDIT